MFPEGGCSRLLIGVWRDARRSQTLARLLFTGPPAPPPHPPPSPDDALLPPLFQVARCGEPHRKFSVMVVTGANLFRRVVQP